MPALSVPSGTRSRRALRGLAAATALAVVPALGVANTATAQQGHRSTISQSSHDRQLAPRTHFTMQADGSSGLTAGGEGIPNIDSVKKTIATYYGDPGSGIADKTSSPYIAEMAATLQDQKTYLKTAYNHAVRQGEKPALVFDADDTTLWTYDMEVADMHFNFDPARQDVWVQEQRFPATPGMVELRQHGSSDGVTVFGLTGRNDNQKPATIGNLAKVGYTAFRRTTSTRSGRAPGPTQPCIHHLRCAKCTTVEYKAGTRKHIEDLGYDIVLNVGDQWSDLQGGYADRIAQAAEPDLLPPVARTCPASSEPWLAPRTHFTMKPDGSSGLTASGEGIPNIDSVKTTIATYYGDPGTGISNKATSPYITELPGIEQAQHAPSRQRVPAARPKGRQAGCRLRRRRHDAVDLRHGRRRHALQLRPRRPGLRLGPAAALPRHPGHARARQRRRWRGLRRGRSDRTARQPARRHARQPRQGRLHRLHRRELLHEVDSGATRSSRRSTSTARRAPTSCTTIEYKSQTRRPTSSAQGYDIIANVGDQFSDLIGGYADRDREAAEPDVLPALIGLP